MIVYRQNFTSMLPKLFCLNYWTCLIEYFSKGWRQKASGDRLFFPYTKKAPGVTFRIIEGFRLSLPYVKFIQEFYLNRMGRKLGKIIFKNQAGFRKNHSAIDHIFTLTSIINIARARGTRKCFVSS